MKRLLPIALILAACASGSAMDVDPKLDRAVRQAVPVCGDLTLSYDELPLKLPARFTGAIVNMKSARPSCAGALIAVLSPTDGFYLGSPWLIEGEEGTTEQKLKAFTWRNMQENVAVQITQNRTDDGLFPTKLLQTTENGKMALEGELDSQGRIFFFGHFRRLKDDMRAQRVKAFDAFLPHLPTKGAAAGAPVTIVEFSDFECPSCKRSSGYADAILAKYGDKVRYMRYDLPLTMHPWAFSAALAGRAIYRQKPDLFWEYKKQVYANQENLNAFAFWDWARGWAADHDLDMKRYDADVASEEIKTELLAGAGTALSNEVRATPTFMINGAMVDAGDEGKGLTAYIETLLK